MFSERTSYALAKNRLTLAVEERRQTGKSTLDLTESNPTRAGFAYPEDEILAALSDPRTLLYEPHPFGLGKAREAVACYYRDRGCTIDAGQVVLTASTSEAYSFLFHLLGNPGQEIAIPQPSYPLFDYLAKLSSLRTVSYQLVYEDRWRIDLEQLNQLRADGLRAVVVVSPNNPTGSVLTREDWPGIRDFCHVHRLPLIVDEVFRDYTLDGRVVPVDPLAQDEVPVFVLNGLSKTCALPQLKLGWIVVAGPADFRSAALERLEIIADSFLSVGTQVQHSVPKLLGLRFRIQDEIRSRLITNLENLHRLLDSSPARARHVEGGWYAVIRLPRIRSEDDWALELLNNHGVLAHPGYFYDFQDEPYLVVSLLPRPDQFQSGISSLRTLLG